jgi:hypothetical protein
MGVINATQYKELIEHPGDFPFLMKVLREKNIISDAQQRRAMLAGYERLVEILHKEANILNANEFKKCRSEGYRTLLKVLKR